VRRTTRLSWLLSLAFLGCTSPGGGAVEGSSKPTDPASGAGQPTAAPAEPSDGPSPTSTKATGKPPGPPSGAPDELHHLEGRSEAAILAEFGEPSSKRTFTMAQCCTEFQIELYNTYPPNAGHEKVEIQEWTWAYDGYALTVWLHDKGNAWEVLETSRYSDDVEF
jgi:hypothetical protein